MLRSLPIVALVLLVLIKPVWAQDSDPCWLEGVPVAGCVSLARDYAVWVQQLPQDHWRLVPTVGIKGGTHGKECDPSDVSGFCLAYPGAISLPWPPVKNQLRHEVGHVVGAQHDGLLYQRWAAQVWPNGILEGDPGSGYTRRMWRDQGEIPIDLSLIWWSDTWEPIREDFAECYEMYLQAGTRKLDARRGQFMSTEIVW